MVDPPTNETREALWKELRRTPENPVISVSAPLEIIGPYKYTLEELDAELKRLQELEEKEASSFFHRLFGFFFR